MAGLIFLSFFLVCLLLPYSVAPRPVLPLPCMVVVNESIYTSANYGKHVLVICFMANTWGGDVLWERRACSRTASTCTGHRHQIRVVVTILPIEGCEFTG